MLNESKNKLGTHKTYEELPHGIRVIVEDGKYAGWYRHDDRQVPKSMNDWMREIHENAVVHGWWEEERSIGELIALCHSELSEALEAAREGNSIRNVMLIDGKPEGVAIELMDCIIRILDILGRFGLSADNLIAAKHDYNKTRPFKHGKQF